MSTWYNKIVDDLGNIVLCIDYFENELEDAKYECRIKGSLEKSSSALPGITEHRFNQLQEIEAILEHLNIELRKERSKVFRKYLEAYNRVLTSRDAEKFADGEEEVIMYQELINEVALMRNKWHGIIKTLDIKGFQINNVIKLKVAGQEDFRL